MTPRYPAAALTRSTPPHAPPVQVACMLIAQSLLPARRLISDLADLDGKVTLT